MKDQHVFEHESEANNKVSGACGDCRKMNPQQKDHERLENVLESMTDAFIRIDANWCITYVNAAAEHILGRSRNDLLGQNFQKIYSDPTAASFHRQYARSMAEQVPVSFERFYDPLAIWIEVRAYPSAAEGLSIFFRDITERKKTEKALRETERRYTALFHARTISIAHNRIVTDADGRPIDFVILKVNKTFEASSGLKRAAIEGKKVTAVFPGIEDDPMDYIGKYGRIALEGGDFTFETFFRPTGKSYSVYLYSPQHGEVTAIFTDITERKRTEKALRESRADLNRAQNVAHIGSWRLDIRRNELLWSDETYRIFGIPEGTPLTYQTFLSAVYPEDRDHVESSWNAALEGKPYDIEHRIIAGDAVKWVREKAELEFDDQGGLLGGFGITQDITELKKTQQRLEASNRELEQFAYVASHDLQEPLRMVASYTELLNRRYGDRLDERARGYMDYIVEGSKRMQRLVQDLLTFSRVGRLQDGLRRIDTVQVVETVKRNLAEAIRSTGARVTCDPLPMVTANETNLIQLFQNLIGNAIKFRKKEVPPRIHVGVRRKKRFWEFSVTDNGIGIDPKYFTKLFVVFRRLHSRDQYAGTGIGLAICKKIVEAHGGRIWVASEPGEQTTFYFTLPEEGK